MVIIKKNLQTINTGENVGKREPAYTVSDNLIGIATVENSVEVLRRLNIELPYDPAIPLLGIHPEKTITQKDTCTPTFMTTARTWKQPKCPSTEKLIKKKIYYIYTMEYLLLLLVSD